MVICILGVRLEDGFGVMVVVVVVVVEEGSRDVGEGGFYGNGLRVKIEGVELCVL